MSECECGKRGRTTILLLLFLRRRNVWRSTSLLFFPLPSYSPFFPPSRLYTPALFPQSWGRGFDKFIAFGAYCLQNIIFKYVLLNLGDNFRCGFLNSCPYLGFFFFSALFFLTLCPALSCLQLRASLGGRHCRRTEVVWYSTTLGLAGLLLPPPFPHRD